MPGAKEGDEAACGVGDGDGAMHGTGKRGAVTLDADDVATCGVKKGGRSKTSTQLPSWRESKSRGGEEQQGENILIKDNMMRWVRRSRHRYPLVIRVVPEEKIARRARGKFVRRDGGCVGIAGTLEDPKVLIRGVGAEEGEERSVMRNCLRGKANEKIGGSVQGLSLVASRKRILKEETTQHVGGCANHALGSTILRRGVKTRHLELHAVGQKEDVRHGVIKLTSIITLNNLDGMTKLSRHPHKEIRKVGEGAILTAEGKGP
jgi:hypothetical protein